MPSSTPNGAPCVFDKPWFFDPKPIIVLTIIIVGLSLLFFALTIALSIALISLPSLTSNTFQLDAINLPLTSSEKDKSNAPSNVTALLS